MKSKQLWKQICSIMLCIVLTATPTNVLAGDTQSMNQLEQTADEQEENDDEADE